MSPIPFAKKLAGVVAFHQQRFVGKGSYWFKPLYEELGFSAISENFVKNGYLIILFVVCADHTIFKESTDHYGDMGNFRKSAESC